MPIMINWQLSLQETRWPVSRDHIAGSGLELIEVACFLEAGRWPNAGFSFGSRAHVSLLVKNRAGLFESKLTLTH